MFERYPGYFAAALCVAALYSVASGVRADDNAGFVDMARSAGSDYRFRASDMIGMDVINDAEESIGEVDDVIFGGRDAGPAAVIATGGFFGLGEKLVTVPVDTLKLSADRERVVIDLSEEQLEALEEFAYNEGEKTWAELKQEREEMIAEQRAEVAEAREELAEERREVEMDVSEAVWDQIAGNWQQFKGRVKQQWGKLTDDELTEIDGSREVLVGKLQEHYGLGREAALREANDWALSL